LPEWERLDRHLAALQDIVERSRAAGSRHRADAAPDEVDHPA
jgi:hypothetical protein